MSRLQVKHIQSENIMKTQLSLILILILLLSVMCVAGENISIDIDATAPRVEVNPNMYGLFFEEINHAGEGGLYGEMVLNRDFEINTLPDGAKWSGNLLETDKGWHERKWFSNELHG